VKDCAAYLRLLQEKLVLAEKKVSEVMAMYKCKLRETSALEEKNSFVESELKMCQDKLRRYEVEMKFNQQCYGQSIQMLSQCHKSGSGRIKVLVFEFIFLGKECKLTIIQCPPAPWKKDKSPLIF